MDIHETAIVHPKARIDKGVKIGPYSIIGEYVKIGRGTVVGPHVVIKGWTTIGGDNRIFQFASIGEINQDLKYRGEETHLEIGERNTIREYVTMQIGTEAGGGLTKVGDDNLFMNYSHVAHDCIIGNGCIMANVATLGGHITIDDGAIIGGMVGIHQFCRVGRLAIIGGCSKVTQDIPPFMMADGPRAVVRGVNLVGLKRRDFSEKVINGLKRAYRILYRSGLNVSQAVEKMEAEPERIPEVVELAEFIKGSERGIAK
ncbi:MAG: acyl-ACP--UDP-N-acetylglucosamine O-acyltransferase [Candidatus Tritonobacter lacicola]|nr:acyl-ACP--UDP-N-acetylglucosamine O-acyltransferase [Candidatus Tritonobacter lacicola]